MNRLPIIATLALVALVSTGSAYDVKNYDDDFSYFFNFYTNTGNAHSKMLIDRMYKFQKSSPELQSKPKAARVEDVALLGEQQDTKHCNKDIYDRLFKCIQDGTEYMDSTKSGLYCTEIKNNMAQICGPAIGAGIEKELGELVNDIRYEEIDYLPRFKKEYDIWIRAGSLLDMLCSQLFSKIGDIYSEHELIFSLFANGESTSTGALFARRYNQCKITMAGPKM